MILLTCDKENGCQLTDQHLAQLYAAKEKGTVLLRSYFRNEDSFLELFEQEIRSLSSRVLRLDVLLRDAVLLLPPSDPVQDSGEPIDTGRSAATSKLTFRLPSTEMEYTLRAIGVFLQVTTFCIQH
ncbi:unnamed protein product [Protopolystoma xenopodis]|uniref:CLEC16A/TT9 C-terminal domain-containing protein n=1 Tax=Protopolystoma xenopodis TaxID=117903 RepID=A0A448WRE9_9PLAT|nr:unnamed protein product [Protopolystoma xenopodis]